MKAVRDSGAAVRSVHPYVHQLKSPSDQTAALDALPDLTVLVPQPEAARLAETGTDHGRAMTAQGQRAAGGIWRAMSQVTT
ncbi:MAG: hypothetical protein JO252_23840 [Planctomycetaceae bacterium]|nr:hypothetical protein [Planctomycetaceae bacterium]